ncbi:hypothetical protein M3P05_20845, partial [Sansalvadorimonas sp. 2012CJ34-2]
LIDQGPESGFRYTPMPAADSGQGISSVFNYRVSNPRGLSLREHCQACICGNISESQYQTMQQQMADFIEQIEGIDIWYG